MSSAVPASPLTPLQAVEQQIKSLQRQRRDLLRLEYYKKLLERRCRIGDDTRWGQLTDSESQVFGSSRESVLVDLINKGLEAEISRLSKGLT